MYEQGQSRALPMYAADKPDKDPDDLDVGERLSDEEEDDWVDSPENADEDEEEDEAFLDSPTSLPFGDPFFDDPDADA